MLFGSSPRGFFSKPIPWKSLKGKSLVRGWWVTFLPPPLWDQAPPAPPAGWDLSGRCPPQGLCFPVCRMGQQHLLPRKRRAWHRGGAWGLPAAPALPSRWLGSEVEAGRAGLRGCGWDESRLVRRDKATTTTVGTATLELRASCAVLSTSLCRCLLPPCGCSDCLSLTHDGHTDTHAHLPRKWGGQDSNPG